MADDFALAQVLQAQFDAEDAHEEMANFLPEEFRVGTPSKKRRVDSALSIVDPEWEDLDPTPGKTNVTLPSNEDFELF
jgi:hypothetical protein